MADVMPPLNNGALHSSYDPGCRYDTDHRNTLSPSFGASMQSRTTLRNQDMLRDASPTLVSFNNQAVIILNIHNVVKILGLYRKLHSALEGCPGDGVLQERFAIVNRWVGNILENYDDLSKDSRVVVDLFVENWGSQVDVVHGLPTA